MSNFVSCKLLQRIHLDGLFIITPVSIQPGVVELHIVRCDNHLDRAEYFLKACDEYRAKMERGKTDQPPGDKAVVDYPGYGSDRLN